MVDYPHSKPTIGQEEIDAVNAVLLSLHLEDGEYVNTLEKAFKNYFSRNFAVAVSNGFAAIHLSLVALNIKSGDEVIIPSYTCAALLNPVLLLNAKPVIVDVSPNSFNIDVKGLRNKISKRTKAIIVPHTFGYPANIDDILTLGIPVIEDCAQAIGGIYKNKFLGQFGTLSIFSFYASKMICSGDGGMIITDDEKIYKKIINYKYYGHKKLHKYVAYNYHLTNLPAALALVQLKKVVSFIERRKHIAIKYDKLLSAHNKINIDFENKVQACYYRYPIRLSMNIEIVKYRMLQKGIQCGYGVLEGMHQILELDPANYKNTENNLNTILSLPIYPSLKDTDVQYISEKLIKIVELD
jgi:perosamine synthetase